MKLREFYINSNQGTKIIFGALLIAMTLNFQGLSDWANSKEVSSFTVLLVKLAQALNEFGEDVKINSVRSKLRTAFINYKTDRSESKVVVVVRQPILLLETMTIKHTADLIEGSASNLVYSNPEKLPVAKIEGAIYPSREDAPKLARTTVDPKNSAANIATSERAPAAIPTTKVAEITPVKFDSSSAIMKEAGLNNRVLVLGDSMLKSGIQVHIKTYFSKKLPQVEIDIDSQSGTGLSRPEVFNWPDRLREKKGKYDYIVIMLGTNDAQNFAFGKKVVSFGTEAWDLEYNNRVKALTELACEKSNKVFWVGNIQMKSEKFNEKMKRLHGVAKMALPTATCAEYVSPEKWVSDGDKYVDHINVKKKNGIVKNIKVRTEDGIHLSFEGAELFAKKLIEKVGYGTN